LTPISLAKKGHADPLSLTLKKEELKIKNKIAKQLSYNLVKQGFSSLLLNLKPSAGSAEPINSLYSSIMKSVVTKDYYF
jgi:hypothetical protein